MVLLQKPYVETAKIKKNQDTLLTSIIDRRCTIRISKNTFETENFPVSFQILQANEEMAENIEKFLRTPECFVDTSHVVNFSLPKKILLPIKITLPLPDFSKNFTSPRKTVLTKAEKLVAVAKLPNNNWKIIDNVVMEKLNSGASFEIWGNIQR